MMVTEAMLRIQEVEWTEGFMEVNTEVKGIMVLVVERWGVVRCSGKPWRGWRWR